jgi:hypothetical protein
VAAKNGTTGTPVIDFKAFRKERQRRVKPLVVDFGEEKLEMPAGMPASIMLDIMAWSREQEAEGGDTDISKIPPDMGMEMLNALLGGDQLKQVAKRQQMDMDELMWLFEQLLSFYMGDIAAAQSGNGTARLEKASTS